MKKFNNGNPVNVCDNCSTILTEETCPECGWINNISKISSILKFGENTFYYIIVAEDYYKEPFKSYIIDSEHDLNTKLPDIIEICTKNKLNAYLYINSRDMKDVTYDSIQESIKLLRTNNLKDISNLWNTCCADYYKSIIPIRKVQYNQVFLKLDQVSKAVELINSCSAETIIQIPQLTDVCIIVKDLPSMRLLKHLFVAHNMDSVAVLDDVPVLLLGQS